MNFERAGLLFCQNKKQFFGGFNENLDLVIPFEYKGINRVYEARGKRYLCVQKAVEWGVIDLETYEYSRRDRGCPPLCNEDFIKKQGDKYTIVNILGDYTLPLEFDEIKPLDETPFYPEDCITYFEAKKDEKLGVIDSTGKIKTDFEYSFIKHFQESDFIYLEIDSMWVQVINLKTDKIVFNSNISDFSRITASLNHLFILKDDIWTVLDENGDKVSDFVSSKGIETAHFTYLADDCFIVYDKDEDYAMNFRLCDKQGEQKLVDKYAWIDPIEGGNYLLCSLPSMDFIVNEIVDKNGEVIVSELGAAFGSCNANMSLHKFPLNFLDIEDDKKIITVDDNLQVYYSNESNSDREKIMSMTNAGQIFTVQDDNKRYYAISFDKIFSINNNFEIMNEIEAELFDDYLD